MVHTLSQESRHRVEARQHNHTILEIIARNGEVERAIEIRSRGTGVRAVYFGGTAFFASEDDSAITLSRLLAEVRGLPGRRCLRNPETCEEPEVDGEVFCCWNPTQVSIDEYKKVATGITTMMLAYHQAIVESFALFRHAFGQKLYADSSGNSYYMETAEQSCSIMVCSSNGRDEVTAYRSVADKSSAGTFFKAVEDSAQDVCLHSVELLGRRSPRLPQMLPVVFDNWSAGAFVHETVGHLSEAWPGGRKGRKWLEPGTRLSSTSLSVIDLGHLPGAKGFTPVDDEGVRSIPVQILKEGIFSGWLHTRASAARIGVAPTGNARAVDSGYEPIARMRITVVEAGNVPPVDLFRGIETGIYVKGYMSGQAERGWFHLIPYETILIRNGQPGERIPTLMITGHMLQTLHNVDMVANDLRQQETFGGCEKEGQGLLPVSMWAPHLRVSEVGIKPLRLK